MRIEPVENGTRAGAVSVSPSTRKEGEGDFAQALAGARSEYTVRPGDTLSHVVLNELRGQGEQLSTRELYSRVQAVADANSLGDPDRIFPGQRIDLSALRSRVAEQPADGSEKNLFDERSNASILVETERPPKNEHENVVRDSRLRGNDNSGGAGEVFGDRLRANSSVIASTPHEVTTLDATEAKSTSAREEFETSSASGDPDAVFSIFMNSLPPSPWRAILDGPARLTSEFGGRTDPIRGGHEHHDGIDLAVKRGTRVFPIGPGTVVESGWQGGLGNTVVIRHEDGTESVYGHNSRVMVSPGEKVTRETPLALTGSTGFATGPHLHLEVRRAGAAVDPVPLLTTGRSRSGA